MNYEEARGHLICRLAASEDESLLCRVPFGRAFEDVMAVPCCYQRRADGQAVGTPVSFAQLAQWDIAPGQLLRDAVLNMQRLLPPVICPMSSLMESAMSGSLKSALLSVLRRIFFSGREGDLNRLAEALARQLGERMQEERGLMPMWVLGNREWLLGASGLLFPGVLKAFGERADCSFYILPASIHEVILLPEGGTENREFLYEMVQSANSRLDPEKFFSSCVYYYDRNRMEIQTL